MFSCCYDSHCNYYPYRRYCPNYAQAHLVSYNDYYYGQYYGMQHRYDYQQLKQQQPRQMCKKIKNKNGTGGIATAATTNAGCSVATGGGVTKAQKPAKASEAKKAHEALCTALAKSIEPTNKGFELMRKMGYKDGEALGKCGNGIVEPIAIALKHDRKGLGVKVEEKRVVELPTTLSKKQRKRMRREERLREQQRAEAAAAKIAPKTTTKQQKPATVESMDVDVSVEQVKVVPETTVKQPRKHSPIRAPSPSPTSVAKTTVKAVKCATVNTPIKPAATTAKILTKPINAPAPKSLLKPLPQPLPKPLKRQKFSLKDPATSQHLQAIAKNFHDEIELLQLRLAAEATLRADNNASGSNEEPQLLVAKLFIANNQPIAEHTYEFIRTELVGWIGKYQHQQLDTPIFHSMANNDTHITIICENTHAYECLRQCVAEITQLRTCSPLTLVRLPSLSQMLYCYGAVYAGIIRDATLFLTQVRLHKAALYADRWIVVAHEVCMARRETHFIFLLDEPSALALTYHHNSRLFICMQLVEFTLRGRVSPTV